MACLFFEENKQEYTAGKSSQVTDFSIFPLMKNDLTTSIPYSKKSPKEFEGIFYILKFSRNGKRFLAKCRHSLAIFFS